MSFASLHPRVAKAYALAARFVVEAAAEVRPALVAVVVVLAVSIIIGGEPTGPL